jgi:predicted metal-binding membrane protein
MQTCDVSPVRQFVWLHPEWWSVAISAFAWTVMLDHCWQHGRHGIHHWMTFPEELQHWVLMIAAMMLPLILDAVQWTAGSSLWRRRHRAIAGFLVGYLAPWLAVGVVAAGLREQAWTHAYAVAAVALALAAVWQLTPMHRRGLTGCHRRRPLAPVGWRADRDCLRFGSVIGVACVVSCWPLMLGCALTGHGLTAMTGGMAIGWVERRSFRPRPRAAAAAALALSGYYLLLAIVGHPLFGIG